MWPEMRQLHLSPPCTLLSMLLLLLLLLLLLRSPAYSLSSRRVMLQATNIDVREQRWRRGCRRRRPGTKVS